MERRDWTSSNNWSYSIITCLFGLGEYMLGQDFIRDTHLAGHSRVLVFAVILLVEPADHVVTAFLRLLHHGAAQLHILVWVGWIGDSQGDSSLSLEHPVFDPASRGVDNEVRPVPVKPQRGDLGRTILESEGEKGKGLRLPRQQVGDLFGN